MRRGSIDPNNLFLAEEVTDAVVEECRDVPERVDELQSVIRSQGPPTSTSVGIAIINMSAS